MLENEEPEGPDLPPKKAKGLVSIEKHQNYKGLKTKGIIAAITAALVLIMYIVYSYYYYEKGVKLNELYFIAVGSGTAIFTGLLFTFFSNRYVKTILLFACVFYTILEIVYTIMWVFYNKPYAYIKWALFIGLALGIIYFIYDSVKNDS